MIQNEKRWVERVFPVEVWCDHCGKSARVDEVEANRCYEFEYSTLQFSGGYHSTMDSMVVGPVELHYCERCTSRMYDQAQVVRLRRETLDIRNDRGWVDPVKIAMLYGLTSDDVRCSTTSAAASLDTDPFSQWGAVTEKLWLWVKKDARELHRYVRIPIQDWGASSTLGMLLKGDGQVVYDALCRADI